MNKNLKYFFVAAGLIFLGFAAWYFKTIISYIAIAAVIALIGHPLVDLLSKIEIGKFRIPKALNAFIVLFGFWFLIFAFLRFFIPLIASQADEFSKIDTKQLLEQIQEPVSNLESLVIKYQDVDKDTFSFENYIEDKIVSVLDVSYLKEIFSFLSGMLGDIFIAIFAISFLAFFFLKDRKLFIQGLNIFIPRKYEPKVVETLVSIRKMLARYFIGLLVEVLLIIILVTIGLSIVGLKFETAILIGLFAGMMNVIPYVGPIIGTIFGLIIGLATQIHLGIDSNLMWLIVYMLIVFLSVQVLDNVLFQPLIYSNSVNAHPIEIFLVILIAGSLAGIAGMILAIPSYTILRVIGKQFFSHFEFVDEITSKIQL